MQDRYPFIPQELKTNGLFCYWKLADNGKVPYNPISNQLAKSNNEKTFCNYMLLCKYTEKMEFDNKTSGIGLGIFNGYSAIDIDHCVNDDGVLSEMATDIIRYCNSYTELSPSGTGIRIIFKTKNIIQKEHYYIQNHNIGLEIYVSNNTNKFVTLTGNHYKNNADTINTIDLTYILNKYMVKDKVIKSDNEYQTIATPINNFDLDIVLSKDAKLKELWFSLPSGSGGNESETDLALCSKLAYYCKGNRDQTNKLFMTSPYYQAKDEAHKAKWEIRQDYRQSTINKACASIKVYADSKGEQVINEKFDMSRGTDTGNAHLFINKFGSDYRYNADNKKWMFWNGTYWQFDTKNQIYNCFPELIHTLENDLPLIQEEDVRKEYTKNIKRLYNKSTMDNVLELAATMDYMPVTNSQFDTNPYYLNTKSGLIDLRNKSIVENNREQYISLSTQCEVKYTEPTKFLKFLDELTMGDKVLQDYIHRVLGYSLLGVIREPFIYLFYGNGRNGKSLLLSVIRQTLGDYSQTLDSGALVEHQYGKVDRGQIAMLVHKRFIVSEETKETDNLDEVLIKNLTSAGEMEGKVLYGNPFKFRIEGKVFSSTNYLPKIHGNDYGIWRRIKVIPCDHQVTDDTDNLDLEKELLTEKEQILGWLINGCIEYQKRGLFGEPQRMTTSFNEYRQNMDIITEFISDCCVVGEKYYIKARTLFKAFDQWRYDKKEAVLTECSFGRRLSKFYKKYQTNDGRYYAGIALKNTAKDVAREIAYQEVKIDYDTI